VPGECLGLGGSDREGARAAEARWEEMGDEIPEGVRGKRVGLESYEVAFDVEMVR
jgi:hypothetical protein